VEVRTVNGSSAWFAVAEVDGAGKPTGAATQIPAGTTVDIFFALLPFSGNVLSISDSQGPLFVAASANLSAQTELPVKVSVASETDERTVATCGTETAVVDRFSGDDSVVLAAGHSGQIHISGLPISIAEIDAVREVPSGRCSDGADGDFATWTGVRVPATK
jgi:hypothetical protein